MWCGIVHWTARAGGMCALEGHRPAQELSQASDRVRDELTACFQDAHGELPTGGTGHVELRVRVEPDGRVSDATWDAGTANPALAGCLSGQVRALTFTPRPDPHPRSSRGRSPRIRATIRTCCPPRPPCRLQVR